MSKNQIIKELEKAHIKYEWKEYPCDFESSEHAADVIGIDADHIAKCMVYRMPIGIAVIILAGSSRIDRVKYKKRFKVDPIPLDQEDLLDYTGYEPGAVSPIALTYKKARVYMDCSLKPYLNDEIYPSGGTLNSAVRIRTQDLYDVCRCIEWVDVSRA